MSINCIIITIGDELLIGQTIDTNSAFIAQQLIEIGIGVRRRIAIGDNKMEILDAIKEGMENADVLIFTGGLGPTKDDITKKTIAEYFGANLIRHSETYEHVKQFFEHRKKPFLPENEAQADVLDCSEVLFNPMGTAPGMWIEKEGKILILLPGVPFEMEHLISQRAVPKLLEKFKIPPLQHFYIQTAGIGESFLAKQIEDIENHLPKTIKLAYLPKPYRVILRLSTTHDHKEEASHFRDLILERIGKNNLVGTSPDDISSILINTLNQKNKKLLLIEQGTQAWLASQLTDSIPKTDSLALAISGKDCLTFLGMELNWNWNENEWGGIAMFLLEKFQTDYVLITGKILNDEKNKKKTAKIAILSHQKNIIETADLFYNHQKNKEALAAKSCWEMLKFLEN